MAAPSLEGAVLRHKHRLLQLRDELDKEAFFLDEAYSALHTERYDDMHTHRLVLRDMLPARDYALAMSMSRITEREFEELYDMLALYASDATPSAQPGTNLGKELCRVLVGLFQQGCTRQEYYTGWARKLQTVIHARACARAPLLESALACLWKIEI
ncbi:MC015L [Molluscum contagiosum virus subtype 1]|uniref:MC015L n=3 Tax=Molluscum contagiosum virus TaxID=10279 RepID=Q98186_MCV1|nr:MC015L [Molluscum contagiosum virus subtype 1]AZT86308.1 MC015L [Molluscum contagiosum virus]AAB57935.1 hypothetical protein [Molluscum contagiosum virus subtype 1]AAC55143.1 MC015L [Molluscum contagiosum virus subtype 1]AQY16757.1 MC015 [Molluscum contagiosum virus subtype 1]AQY16938.1 MC015 [Molluscum contagiosum virus subtype 1]